MDKQLFHNLCEEYKEYGQSTTGIGTLSEKTIHAVLKDYMDSNKSHQEQPFAGYIADIYDGSAIVEVQTRNFDRLRGKLSAFLPLVPVTIVYPMPDTKWLNWVDVQTGEITDRRKSPKRGNPVDIMKELYKIKPFLTDPNLHLHLIFMDLEEYRLLNGWSRDHKKGSTRMERIPICLSHEITIDTPRDYKQFLPDSLPEQFTSTDYKTLAKTTLPRARTALNILTHMNTVIRCGKKGNTILYERNGDIL